MFFLGDKKVEMEELVQSLKPADAGLAGWKPGWQVWNDVLAFAIQHVTCSWCNHAFLYTGMTLEPPGGPFGLKTEKRDWLIIEAIGKGVTPNKLSNYAGNRHIVKFARHFKATDEDRPEIVKSMFKQVGQKYDWGGLFGFFLRPLWPFSHNFLSWENSKFCSAAVAVAYASRRLWFRTDIDPTYVSPGAIWGSGAVEHL